MGASVVDSSALAALVFGEPEAPAIADRLDGTRLLAPALLPFEMASVCLKKIRSHPGQRDAILDMFALAQRMDVAIVDTDHAAVVALAERTGLTSYDAAYLWLSLTLKAELVTLDRRLAELAD